MSATVSSERVSLEKEAGCSAGVEAAVGRGKDVMVAQGEGGRARTRCRSTRTGMSEAAECPK